MTRALSPRALALAAIVLLAVLVGRSAPAAVTVYSFDRLRLGDAAGSENYVFTGGNVIYPEAGVDNGSYYRFVVFDSGGATRNGSFPCTPAAAFGSTDNTYTVQASDPVSTGTAWRFTLQQFANSACSGSPAKTTTKSFYVAKASTFADTGLTTPRTTFGASATAYVTIAGVKPGVNDWSTTWLLPSGSVACANTAGNDQPDSASSGALPKPGGGFIQYRPGGNGSLWNRESNYETAPCPAFSGNDGLWKLRVQVDATNFVVVPAFTVDSTPPPTPAITSGPSGPTGSNSATFTFSDPDPDATFQCRLDSVSFVACSSPQTYTGLAEGNHSLEVKAVDAAANESGITARTWVVDLTAPPAPSITSGPTGTSASSSATFAFSDSEPGVGFRCQLDGGGFSDCTSPHGYSGLAEGAHTFQVTAQDGVGNTSAAASRNWVVDTKPPVVTITDGPSGTTASQTASFSFVADEAGSTFQCKLDAGTFAACSSPAAYSGLASGDHTIQVRATDLGGSTSAPVSRTWTIDAAAPSVTLAFPQNGSTTSDSAPTFSGTAGQAAGDASLVVVTVYAGTTPTGTPVLALSGAVQLDGSYSVDAPSPLVDGTYTAQAEQSDALGNTGRSSANTFAIDTAASTVTITAGPADPTNQTTASLTFSANEAGVTFQCRLAPAAFAACTSPKLYAGLSQGPHTFQVKAVDGGGNESAVAEWTWTVDTTPPPAPTITSGPSGTTVETSATFGFSDTEPGVAFTCQLDGGGYAACTSPKAYTGLADGAHSFQVKAVDQAGNESSAATRNWTVDTTPPTVTITSSPASPTNQTSASFSFTSDQPGSTFECRLDGGAYTACTSPKSYTGLAEGVHGFDVKATDSTGNEGPAAHAAWTVDLTAPSVTLAQPPDGSSTPNPTPTFSGTAGTSAGDATGVTVKVYSGSTATGVPLQTLPASVQPDGSFAVAASSPLAGTYTARAEQSDAAGNLGQSAANTFSVEAPDTVPPTVTLTTPANGSATSDATPTFAGTGGVAPGDSSLVAVKVYAGTTPTGTPALTLSAGVQAGGSYSVDATSPLVGGTYTAQAEQSDAAANVGVSAAHTFVVDTVAPVVTITAGPANPTNATGASFTFGADEAGATFVCRLGPGSFAACTSPKSYSGLAEGSHTFEVKATDAAGNQGAAAGWTWVVDTTPPPAPAITSGPSGTTTDTSASFAFSDAEAGAAFVCRLDGATFAGCTSPHQYTGLGDGSHTFQVAAVDAAGNQSAAATRTWTVDTSAPVATITSSPANPSNQTGASFAFSSNEPGSTFECRLDGGGYSACTSPKTYSGLSEGSHTFDVRALDGASNAGPAASFTWTIDVTTPTATITSGPTDPSGSGNASFVFTASEGGSSFQCQLNGGGFAACTSPKGYSGLADGSHTFQVKAVDTAGNASSPATSTWRVDTTAPTLTLTSPANGSSTTNTTPTFSGAGGTATGDSPLVTVKVYSGGSATGTPVQTLTATVSSGSWSVPASSPLALGTYTARAEQVDTAGNAGQSTANTFTVTAADPTPPAVSLTTPANGSSTTDATPTFAGNGGTAAGDLATVTVKVYNGTSATGSPTRTVTATRDPGSGAYSVDLPTALGGGIYTAQAEQADSAGNVGTSSANTFVVESPYRTAILADNPGGYWRLGEAFGTTAADETGTNPGTYQNGVVLGQPGALAVDANTAASFDGVNDIVSVPSSASLNATTGVTMEAWVKRSKSGAWQNVLAKPGNGAVAAQNYALWINTTNQPAAFFGNGSSSVGVYGPALDTNWHHVAATYDNATAKIYVDGVLQASATSSVQLTANTGALTIGRTTDNNRIFGGLLDEPAVYRTALPASTIQAHYVGGSSFDATPPAVTLTQPANGSTTDNAQPTFSGAAGTASGDLGTVTVRVYAGGTPTGTPVQTLTTTQSGGSWSVPASSPLAEGTYTAQAEQLDAAGNVGRSSATTFNVTSADISPPAVTLTTPADGSSSTNHTPTLSGAAGTAPGDLPTITVKIWSGITPAGTPIQTLTATATAGSWSTTAATLADGAYAARAEQLDGAGNIGLSTPHTFTIGTTYREEILTDNPGGYWRLGEASGTTAASETGANAGTYQNGVVLGQPGALTAETNTAASFDGVNDIVSVPSSASLNATTGVTVEAWVKRSRSGAWQNVLAKPGNGAAAAQNYALWINTTNQPAAFFGNGSSSIAVYGPAIDTNWHHIAATYDNATAKMYVDGVLQASVSSNINLTANTGALTIGRTTDNNRIFGGLIDEPAVYRTALPAARIQEHYAKGNALDDVPPVVTLTTPGDGTSTLNTVPHFAGEASVTGTDSPTVTAKIYNGSTATGTPVQTVTATRAITGAWSVDASGALPLGTYTARAEQADTAGNVGTSASATFAIVPRTSSPDPLFAGAGDIGDCTDTGVQQTANLILGLPSSTTVFTLGDNAYPHGAASDFANCYDPYWGQFKSRTRPSLGDHEYETPNASGYFNYFANQLAPFGASATDPSRGYYSYDIGTWHVAVLNAACGDAPGCTATAQASWLDSDLNAHPNQCTLAILSAPRWSSGSVHGNNATMGQYFVILYDHGVELVMGGDDHVYERFAPQDPQGFYDPAQGVRQFVAGTGGGSLYTFGATRKNSEVRRSGNYGILKLTLHSGTYEWEYIPSSGIFSDSGTTACH